MTNKNLNLSTLAVCLACSTTLLLGACGGGGSGKTRTPSEPTAEEATVGTETPGNSAGDAIPAGEIDADQFVTVLGKNSIWQISSTLTTSDLNSGAAAEALPVNVTSQDTLQITNNTGTGVDFRSCGEVETRYWSSSTAQPLPVELIDAKDLIANINCADPSATYEKLESGALKAVVECTNEANISAIFTKQDSSQFNSGYLELNASADSNLVITGEVCAGFTQFRPDLTLNSELSAIAGLFPALTFNQDILTVSGLAETTGGSERIALTLSFSGGIAPGTYTIQSITTLVESGIEAAIAVDAENIDVSQDYAAIIPAISESNGIAIMTSPLLTGTTNVVIDSGSVTVTEANAETGRYVGSYELTVDKQLLTGNFDVSL